jgi:site-specific DNA-methyltransferase (adenine-specific)
LAITSPPYNLDKEYNNHDDNMEYNKYLKWMGDVWKETKRVLVSGGRLCINIGSNKRQTITYPTYSAFIQQCVDLGMLYRGTVIWNKESAAKMTAWGSFGSCSNPHFVPRHEYILVFSKDNYKLEGDNSIKEMSNDEFVQYTRTIWNFSPESKKKIGHPAPFPEELPKRLIKFLSYKDNIILDMFSGSGTTGLVAKKLGRDFILIDNSKEYCELALKRIKRELSQTKLNSLYKNDNKISIVSLKDL